MSRKILLFGRLTAILALAAFGSAIRAEISVVAPNAHRPVILVVGIDDAPDPIGLLAWQSFSAAAYVLNADGELRGDDAPDLAVLPIDGRPVAVWSYASEFDRDVAFSEWTPAGWEFTQFLSAVSADDIDPRIFVEPDGTINVVWWRRGPPDRVIWITKPAGSANWGPERDVAAPGVSCRRPSIVLLNGVVRIAYERDSNTPGAAQEIVVSEQLSNGTFEATVVGQTPRAERLDVVLHSEFGRLWADWKVGDGVLGYSRFDGSSFTPVLTLQAPSASWIGVEDARRSVRRVCMTP